MWLVHVTINRERQRELAEARTTRPDAMLFPPELADAGLILSTARLHKLN